MSNELNIVKEVIQKGLDDENFANNFLANPAEVLQNHKFPISEEDHDGFNSHFEEVAGDVIHQEFFSIGSIGGIKCHLCKMAVYPLALEICKGGDVIDIICHFIDCDQDVPEWINEIRNIIDEGPSAVASSICHHTGAC